MKMRDLSQLTPLDNILTAIKMEEPERVPVATLEQEHAVKLAGIKYSEYATDGKKLAKTQMLVIKKYSLDFAWVHSDDWIEFEVMGNKVRFFDAVVPTCEEYAVKNDEDADRLEIPNPKKDGRMPVLLEAIQTLSKEIGNRIMICGRVASAFSAAILLRGLETGLKDLYTNISLFEKILKKANEVAKVYAQVQIESGAHALWIGDCLATSRLIPTSFEEKYALPYLKELVDHIRRCGGISMIFTDEKKLDRLAIEAKSRPDVLGIGTGVSLTEAKAEFGDEMCLFGNIDPVNVLLKGEVTNVEKTVRTDITSSASGGGYIFASGEAICRDTPEANLHKMVQTAWKYGRYPIP